MIRDSQVGTAGKETGAVSTGVQQQVKGTRRHLRIEVASEERPRLWKVISDNEWSGEYLGKNVFVFTEEQLATIKAAGIPFRSID